MIPSAVYCDACGTPNRPQARFCVACGQATAATSSLPPTVQAGPAVSSPPPTVPAGSTLTSPPLSRPLPADFLLRQRYIILSQLGQGGMGAVYKAADTELGDRLVAVKQMSRKGLDPQEIAEAAAAFKQEAIMLAGLPHHPNLPSIYDHFEEGGHWYLVMDFIAGETLEEHLAKAGGRLPVEEVLNFGIQLCTVLGYLHSYHPPIIFRDLKPTNVMRMSDGQLYLIDFGIARHFKQGQARDTMAYASAGYSAPEQYGRAQTTPQSDIYSLGATLHHLLTGLDPSQSPFRFMPLSGSGIPTSLGALIAHMVEVNADRRPPSMAVVKQELQRIQPFVAQPTGRPLTPKPQAGGSSRPPTPAVPVPPSQAYPVVPRPPGPPAHPQRTSVSPKPPPAQGPAAGASHQTKEEWTTAGLMSLMQGSSQEALAAYEQAIRLDPNDAESYEDKGNALSDLKRFQEALAAYEQAIRLDPRKAAYYYSKGCALETLGRSQEALEAFEQAIRLDANYARAYHKLGAILEALGKQTEAQQAYTKAKQLGYHS